MNKTMSRACFLAGFITLIGTAFGAPPPTQEPNTPQQQAPVTPSDVNVSPQNANSAAPSRSATPSSPEGLGGAEDTSFMGQDLMTGDWGGLRKELQNDGFKFSPTYIGEVFGNPSGGKSRGLIYDGLLNLPLDLDLEQMSGGDVEGLTIHANAFYIHGTSLSARYVGDFSNTSNIAAYNTLRLDELWIQKWFWEKRVSIKVGNMAVDNEFFQSASASLFINGTFGAFTFIASNVGNAPVYPLAAPGVRIQFLPTSAFYVMSGVYGQDTSSNPTINNKNGERFALTASSGMLVMSEAGYLLNQSPNDRGLQGTYRLGSFVHTNDNPTFDGFNGGTSYGVYGVMDQQIYSKADHIISLFVRTGGAPPNSNFIDYYVDGGFNFAGFIPTRENDVFGLAVGRSHISRDFGDAAILAGGTGSTAETVLEATYKAQIAPWWSIQPDFQYIITPSGVPGSANAVVLGLRTTLAF